MLPLFMKEISYSNVKFVTTVDLQISPDINKYFSPVHEGKSLIGKHLYIGGFRFSKLLSALCSCLERMPRDAIQAQFLPVLHSVLIHHCVVCVYRDSLD